MDRKRIESILQDYYTVTGISVALINLGFHTVCGVRGKENAYCSLLHRSQIASSACKSSDIEHLDTASKTREAQLYTCPYGIAEAIVPIIKSEQTVGYLFASFGMRQDGEQDAEPPSYASDKLAEAKNEVPCLDDGEISAHFNMLKMLSLYLASTPSLIEEEESIGRLIKYYIKKNLDRKITLSDIALSLHCSTVTLTQHFKAEFGITIVEYITKMRMERAKSLLLSTGEPIRVIAAEVGFSDIEYFSRAFKKFYGVPPGEMRRSEGIAKRKI